MKNASNDWYNWLIWLLIWRPLYATDARQCFRTCNQNQSNCGNFYSSLPHEPVQVKKKLAGSIAEISPIFSLKQTDFRMYHYAQELCWKFLSGLKVLNKYDWQLQNTYLLAWKYEILKPFPPHLPFKEKLQTSSNSKQIACGNGEGDTNSFFP